MNNKMISRRKLLSVAATLPVVGTLGSLAATANDGRRTITPRQTEGPFYPRSMPEDLDSDLAVFGNRETLAEGEILSFTGKVLDRQGGEISGARVEIWHCDQYGKYHHVGAEGPLDANFQGIGETLTDGEGHYGFRTIKPGIYPGRTPHIHFKVHAPGRRVLTSQMYFDGEMDRNMRDGIYRGLSSKERDVVTMKTRRSSVADVAIEGMIDIILA